MSKLVQGLESDGYISRKPDRHDGRTIQLQATRRGRAVLQRARERRIDSLEALLLGLDRAQLATLADAAVIIEQVVAP